MKKILALVLALVMTMSLATISSGAAYSDADSVQYVDAVNTMSALGVLGGYGDGTIRPAADVTRGAAAKMVAMVATGSNTTTIGYYKGTSSFADVPATHTFADAVAFCVARGIVAGYGDGNYGVADNVKGWAVAKMVLVAMGYDAKAYGMEGAGSALNTITLATQVGLFADMKADFVATEAASREECAQIVYNALTKEGKVSTPANSDGVVTFEGSETCLLNNYAGVAKVAKTDLGKVSAMDAMAANIGMVTANQDTGATYTKIKGVDYAVETGKELIGHYVLAVKNGAKDAYGKDCVYAVVDLSSVVELASEIKTDTVGKKDKFEAAFGDVVATDTTVADFHNYKTASLDDKFSAANYTANAGTFVIYDGKVVSYMTTASDVVVLTVAASAADQAKGYYTVKNGSDVLVKVCATATDCKDLIVSDEAVNWLGMLSATTTSVDVVYVGTPCGDKLAIADVAVVEGKVTQFNAKGETVTDTNSNMGKIFVDGKEYAYAGDSVVAPYLYATAIEDASDLSFTATYKFYLDENGAVFAYAAVTAEDTNTYELAYITGSKEVQTGEDVFGTKSYAYSVQYYKLDGSVNLSTYVAKDGKTVAHDAGTDASKVTYTDLSAGWALIANVNDGVAVKTLNSSTFTNGYKLDTVASAEDLAATSTTLDTNDIVNSASTFLYSKANSFLGTNKAAEVKTGAHASDLTGSLKTVIKASSNLGMNEVVAVWVGADYVGTAVPSVDFVYVVSFNGQIGYAADGTTPLYQFSVIDKNGVEGTATYTNSDSTLSGFYKLETNATTGLVSLGAAYTTVSENLVGASVYTIDGVKYAKAATKEYVVSSVKVIDLRAAVAAGTAELVSTVEEVAALTSGTATAIYSTDENTGVMTISTIIVA